MRHTAGARRLEGGPGARLRRLLGRSPRARRRRLGAAAVVAALLVGGSVATVGRLAEPDRASAAAKHSAKAPPTPPPSAVGVPPSQKATPAPPAATTQASPAPSSAQPAWQGMPQDITGIINGFLASQGAAGVAVAVSTGNGGTTQDRYLATAGQAAADTPWSTDTRSAYRSITKSFVGTVVLQLVGEGKLGLDDPIAKYVPGVADLQFDGGAMGNQITVREALEMRTGIPEFSGTADFSTQLDTDYTGAFTDDQLLGYAFTQQLDFAPGSAYEYSNTNSVLLGKVIQAVTGQAWDAEVQSRILGPLGLTSVAYSGAQPPAGPVATPYQADDSGLESLAQVSPSLYGASGGLFGDIGDLLTWGRALGSGSLVSPALQQARLTGASDPQADDPGSPDYDAYGLAAGSLDGWWGHTGTGLGYESLTMYNPETGMTIAILINTQLPNPNGPAILFRQLEPSLANFG
ncbi:hypothetical protein GCM10012320_06040 [Sinomonas cellulolyticus]|uniref:Beta-lactamase family protein n=1 Tax=Sinomonas cellulolyticus TaxID=2801916 RepID=A0ABS1K2P0_9MICC|nr:MULTISPECIES: serine hydrolase domain-containing protein [Sinomonas]MBL0705931.1 beta-lactamase family protein [Sinomonas cellulolyticus]GHG42686.1 hypothetical protein GCM10012320_06040 [Sinomonas sp. KCTC 49339]